MMKFQITSITPEERLYAYSQSSQIEGQTGCIGYLQRGFWRWARVLYFLVRPAKGI